MLLLGTVFCAFSLLTVNVEAKGDDTLKKGVYAEEISLAGMTEEEAAEAINAYVDSLKEAEITLLAAGDNEVTVTAGELGLSWKNTDIIEEAKELGMHGNVVQRYKELKDLEHENKVYPIELGFDVKSLSEILGHATVNITMNRYVHPTYEMKKENMQKLSELLAVK